jgi:hypothetical protein
MCALATSAAALALAMPAAAAPGGHQPAAGSHKTTGTAGTSGNPKEAQPQSNADHNSGGANGQCPSGPYCSTRDGSPSGNGNGNGKATGKPCAGCVGKADNKNPQGQKPNGTDHNAGYECDRNHGIGRTNPAHTGCRTTTATCVPTVLNNQCGNPKSDCVPSALNSFCSTVLGEKVTTPPTSTPPATTVSNTTAKKTPKVLGEKLVRTPGLLPLTGAVAVPLLLAAATMLGLGTLLLASARRRRRT